MAQSCEIPIQNLTLDVVEQDVIPEDDVPYQRYMLL